MKINNKGITLIALVITIIVLLILAGVAINSIIENEDSMSKAQEAKVLAEKGEIDDSLSISVMMIKTKALTEVTDKSNYYKDKETFVEAGQFDENMYPITSYEYNEGERKVVLNIMKNGGTGTEFTFEIDTLKGDVICTSTDGRVDDEEDIEEAVQETDDGYFTYSADNKTITGFSNEGIDAFKNGQITELVFPEKHNDVTITQIGLLAFSSDRLSANSITIEKLVIQDNITSLNSATFSGMSSLTELTIPISLNAVYNYGYSSNYDNMKGAAFSGCNNITKVKFTKGSGTGINYSDNGSNYDTYYVFTPWCISKDHLTTIELGKGIQSIGSYMFADCEKIQNVSIPTTVTSIGEYAFNKCTSMAGELNTIGNVTSIGNYAFYKCSSITGTLTIPSGMTVIGQGVFAETGITKLIIHDNVTSLRSATFNSCTSLTELTIPISLNAVYNYGYSSNYDNMRGAAFSGCNNITKVKFTKGSGTGINYSDNGSNYDTYYVFTPWVLSANKLTTIEFDSGIESIGTYTIHDLGSKTIKYLDTRSKWSSVTYDVSCNNSLSNPICTDDE